MSAALNGTRAAGSHPVDVMSGIRRILKAQRLPLWMALAAFALASPGLIVGFQVDDHFLRMALSDPPVMPEWSRTPFDLFAFLAGEPGFVHAAADGGAVPWWAREAALVARRYVFMLFDGLYRDTPIARGPRIRFTEMVVEVTEVTADGRPAEVVYRFDHDLTDPRYRWLHWRDGVYADLTLPEVGKSLVLPPVVVP